MRASLTTLTLSLLATLGAADKNKTPAARRQDPDPSAVFVANLYTSADDCSASPGGGGAKAFLYSRGACQNIAVPGTGSGRVLFNERPGELVLTGWTGPDCSGESVVVGGDVEDGCVALGGFDVVSWSY